MEADNHPQPNTGAIGYDDDGVPYALLLHLPKGGLRGRSVLLEGGRLVVVGQYATRAVSHPTSSTSFPSIVRQSSRWGKIRGAVNRGSNQQH